MSTLTGSAPAATAEGRLLSLDVLRGLVVAGMILVTDPGTYSHVYTQLTHAKWNDPTITDLIFPCFLVMVGISMTLSFSARLSRGATVRELVLHALRRSTLLIVLGMIVNGFPQYHLATIRIPGILQRIGICYLIVSLLYLAISRPTVTRRARQFAILSVCLAVLVIYWLLLTVYPTPGFGPGHLDPLGNLAAVLDRAVFAQPHMFQWGIKTPGFGVTFDPEGILSTLGALGATLFGVLAGDELRNAHSRSRQCGAIAILGAILWLVSLLLNRWMPLNKQIYTPSFALWSAGLSLIAFAALFWLIDILRFRRGWTLSAHSRDKRHLCLLSLADHHFLVQSDKRKERRRSTTLHGACRAFVRHMATAASSLTRMGCPHCAAQRGLNLSTLPKANLPPHLMQGHGYQAELVRKPKILSLHL